MRGKLFCTGMTIYLVFVAISPSFVDPAPLGESGTPAGSIHEDSDVQQLHTLKHSFGNAMAAMKAQVAAEASQVSATRNASVQNLPQESKSGYGDPENAGEEKASVKNISVVTTSAPRPLPASLVSRGQVEVIHGEHQRHNTPVPAIELASVPEPVSSVSRMSEHRTENGQRRVYASRDLSTAIERMDKMAAYANAQYTPMDMAEYIFKTGDEKGVTLAVEEFLQQGLMSRDEAIAFLQEVKYNLDYLQTQYIQSKERTNLVEKTFENVERHSQNRGMTKDYQDLMMEPSKKRLVLDSLIDNQNKNLIQAPQETSGLVNDVEIGSGIFSEDTDYEELLERLRVADFLYTQYTLEEVIYQLASVMFAQSLARGSAQVQEALQKFTSFLESEAAQGRISVPLEKKVLDVLITSLSDTLTKHPDLVATAREGLGGGALQPNARFLQDFLMSRVPARLSSQESVRNHEIGLGKFIHGA